MRIFLIPGLMAATMLTPAAASAAEIAPNLNSGPGLVQVDLTGTARLQRDGLSERRGNRGADRAAGQNRRAQRAENRNNRGQPDLRTRGDRAEARQNRRVDNVDRSLNTNRANRDYDGLSRRAARQNSQDSNVNLATQRDQRVERRVDRRVVNRQDWRQDIRQGDRNRDGRVDRRFDRNRDGQIDRRYDRNNNNVVDRRVDRNRDGRIDQRYRNNRNDARSSRNWNRSWRNDRRYDWQRYRQANRSYYRQGRYYAPYRDYNYRRLSIGISLGSAFYGSRYWINNPSYYRLPPAYARTRWVRYYDDVLLIDTYSGEVIDVIYDFFW
ncbi:MAG: hypothetical protein GW808_10295 [Sphingomonadales bacterium]|nr:hypothetical protein [Sphingomonadales bacterium]PIX66238.1 MAG: hypothetical protein COZ43_07665 [Sphingomonadales bacterium CG_4_10_14_3_um_filter_58_15]NCO50430.1 hypothetical protein [Sphingomonadales bacterium]NCO98590.1 hypothetical protein [Sphingomonadales bacterium]NCP26265.1 hypothetical protein [Sphingomonadales bacterium]